MEIKLQFNWKSELKQIKIIYNFSIYFSWVNGTCCDWQGELEWMFVNACWRIWLYVIILITYKLYLMANVQTFYKSLEITNSLRVPFVQNSIFCRFSIWIWFNNSAYLYLSWRRFLFFIYKDSFKHSIFKINKNLTTIFHKTISEFKLIGIKHRKKHTIPIIVWPRKPPRQTCNQISKSTRNVFCVSFSARCVQCFHVFFAYF